MFGRVSTGEFPANSLAKLLLAGILSVTIVMLLGVTKLRFNDDYKSLFKSGKDDYLQLEKFLEIFPADDQELVILFKTDNFLEKSSIRELQNIVERIEDLPAIESLYSIFSVPKESDTIRKFEPILSVDQSEDEITESLILIGKHPLVKNKLLSVDGNVTVAVGMLEDGYRNHEMIEGVIHAIHQIVDQADGQKRVQVYVTGNAAVRVALKSQSTKDQLVFNSVGGLLAFLITLSVFRSVKISLIVTTGPFIGVIWTLGSMGFSGTKINVINQMISPLVMVIGFTDAIHLMFAVQRRRVQGCSRVLSSIYAVKDVGLACMLTSVTTAIGFAVLLVTDSNVIHELAIHAALGVLLTFVAVVVFIPASVLFLEDDLILNSQRLDIALKTSAVYNKILSVIRDNAMVVVSGGVVLTVATLYLAQQLSTDFKFRENLPQDHEVTEAMKIADQFLNGVQPLNIVVKANSEVSIGSSQAIGLLQRLQSEIAKKYGLHNTISVVDLLKALPGATADLSENIPRLIYLPAKLVERFYNEEVNQTLILVRLPDHGAKQQLLMIQKLEETLTQMAAQSEQFSLTLQGVSLVAAKGSVGMIKDLLASILSAALIIFILISLFLKSIKMGLISFLPNILPLSAVAAVLVVSGLPLQYATIMVFTICLGIIVDDGIHMIVRYKKELQQENDVNLAIDRTLQAVAPVLVVTTLILTAGFVSMLSSATEVIVRMGYLSCLALILALIADLILLPSMIVTACRKSKVPDYVEERL